MDGQRSAVGSGQASVGEHVVGGEKPRPRKVAPWPWATSPWNWSEKRDQFEAKRLKKSEIR